MHNFLLHELQNSKSTKENCNNKVKPWCYVLNKHKLVNKFNKMNLDI